MPDSLYEIPNDPNVTSEDIEPGADLRDVDLTDAYLAEADLTGADLREADVTDADLREADLTDADLRKAGLPGADLREASLPSADLRKADLPNADLRKAEFWVSDTDLAFRLTSVGLTRADIKEADHSDLAAAADLTDAILIGVNLTNARLRYVDLTGSDLVKADLTHADLEKACLTDADLEGADLTDVYFRGANLENADLINANLIKADLAYANLTDTDLRKADLTDTDLRDASLNCVALYDTTLQGVNIDESTSVNPPSKLELKADAAAESRLGWFDQRGFRWLRFLGRSASDPTNLQRAEQQYRRIKRLYREADLSRDPALEIQEKDARRKRALAAGKWGKWLRKAFSRWVLGYGLRIWPIIGVMLLVIGVWTLLYPIPGIADRSLAASPTETGIVAYETLPPSLSMETIETLRRSLYFSTITFSTLGYADVAPVRWGRELATVESFVGALLMAYFVSVLSRRAIR